MLRNKTIRASPEAYILFKMEKQNNRFAKIPGNGITILRHLHKVMNQIETLAMKKRNISLCEKIFKRS